MIVKEWEKKRRARSTIASQQKSVRDDASEEKRFLHIQYFKNGCFVSVQVWRLFGEEETSSSEHFSISLLSADIEYMYECWYC